MADLHEHDPIAAANHAIRDYIRACGGRITDEHRQGYEDLVGVYFTAVRARDEARAADRKPEPVAA